MTTSTRFRPATGRDRPFRQAALASLLLAAACLTGCGSPRAGRAKPQVPESPRVPGIQAQGPAPETFEYFPYHIKRGETLSSLGRRFKVSWQELADINDIAKPDEIPVGRLLIIPKAPGVEVPPLEPPEEAPAESSAARRRSVRPQDLHHGSPSSRFWWPTVGHVVRGFGRPVRGLPGAGIAISAPAGTDVCAVADGTVIACVGADGRGLSAWGRVVALSHRGGYVSWYAYLDSILVRKGQRVSRGEPIGTVGASGAAPAPQLAFRLYHDDRPIDPLGELP